MTTDVIVMALAIDMALDVTMALGVAITGTIIQATTIIVVTSDIASPAVRILTAGNRKAITARQNCIPNLAYH